MKKIKVTPEQYKRLSNNLNESKAVKGGINRANKSIKHEFAKVSESGFDISKSIPGVPNSKIISKKEITMPKSLTEEEGTGTPELHQAIRHFIENVWLNPSKIASGLDRYFVEHNVTLDALTKFLISAGILANKGGVYRVVNYFKRKFSPDEDKTRAEKMQDIDRIATMLEKDPNGPWNTAGVEEGSSYMPPEPDALNPMKEPEIQHSNSPEVFKPIGMGKEIAVFNGPDGMYILYYDDIPRDEMPNPEYELNLEDLADYLNTNYKNMKVGNGLADFEKPGTDLIKLDEPLKNELIALYGKDKELVSILQGLHEMTGTGSAGAFTAPLSAQKEPNDVLGEETLEETTATGGGMVSSPQGQYVQPAIWAKDKKNWGPAKKTQYPKGEMVSFDPCVKLNNNKAAENGKCSQGAVDGVVKTHKTKGSVISKSMYEAIAKKTGRPVDDVQKVIKRNIYETISNKTGKSLDKIQKVIESKFKSL